MQIFKALIFSFVSILTFTVALNSNAQAQNDDLLSVTIEQTSTAATPDEAAREMTAKAVNQAAREQIIDMIGESKYQKNIKTIDAKIIKESSKFIPFVSPGQPVQTPEGFKMSVDLKISESSLHNMALNAGLLADSESPGNILSLVSVTDKNTNQVFRWWSNESESGPEKTTDKSADKSALNPLLSQLNSDWNQALSTELSQKGFKLAQPPKNGALKTSDEKTLIQSYQSQMIVKGEIRVRDSAGDKPGTLAMKVSVVQAKDGRLITDAVRTLNIEKATPAVLRAKAKSIFNEISKDLSGDVMTAWQRGLVGSSMVNIVVRGQLTPKQLNDFKGEFTRSLRELKSLKERRFTAGQVTFEAAYAGDVGQMQNKIRSAQLPSFQMQLASANNPSSGSAAVVTVGIEVRPRR